ncbi:uncharacterized protein ALTATR162_LOCUS234 [Alternaria atra]|uniref:Uncharacterized protein n=1 Tax=Alternaria atra TaxID=119953 RepID=A0A8J2HTM5_9PLEO|nr:uncharacterized protein ALTATR162_LOCUS234 [Alternaria atra]CAG5137869.1 unnamed protein product [Alternaria atra]
MAVIWGLDLKEMQWGKFKSGYMWNTMYHNRRTKFIIYQLAMILCVVSESLGTAALSDYVDQQKFVSKLDRNVTVHNNDYVGIASYNIFVGIFVATIFGAAFFFDLFWPERLESRSVKIAWKVCSVFACIAALADALAYTYIVASKSAYVTGTDDESQQKYLSMFKKTGETPLEYKKNGRAVASVVFLWPGMIFTFVSTYLLWHSLAHIDAHGPMSTHARNEKVTDSSSVTSTNLDGAAPVTQPEPTHVKPADSTV